MLPAGTTAVLLGVSGAGKSTLTNALLGTVHCDTNSMSDARRGRHTTSHRELVQHPDAARERKAAARILSKKVRQASRHKRP